MMHRLLIVALFLVLTTGCGKVSVPSWVPSLPTTPAEDPKVKAEREAQERSEALARLKEADGLVQQWSETLVAEDGSLRNHEGITDPDPWGNMIRIDYSQNGVYETATIRSAGPDGEYSTSDDLLRTRTVTNFWGLHRGLDGWAYFGLFYIACIPIALMFSSMFRERRTRLGKSTGQPHPILVALISPIVVVVYGTMGLLIVIGSAIGAATDGFDVPDFDVFDFFD